MISQVCLLLVIVALIQWQSTAYALKTLVGKRSLSRTRYFMSTDSETVRPDSVNPAAVPEIEDPYKNETAEEKYKREKLAEIAERKAAEVFVKRNTGRFECQACGYIYAEAQGYEKRGIAPGTPFESMENFRCPQCGASKKYFVAETETISGFKENMKYGLGFNAMTGGMKQNIVFGGLLVGFVIFLSGYLLE